MAITKMPAKGTLQSVDAVFRSRAPTAALWGAAPSASSFSRLLSGGRRSLSKKATAVPRANCDDSRDASQADWPPLNAAGADDVRLSELLKAATTRRTSYSPRWP